MAITTRNYKQGSYEATGAIAITDAGADNNYFVLDDLGFNYAVSDVRFWTDAGMTTEISTSDYTLTESQKYTTSEAATGGSGKTVYLQYKITNGTYQTGTIYVSCNSFGAFLDNDLWGTAATADVQTSSTDTTPGRVVVAEGSQHAGLSAPGTDYTLTPSISVDDAAGGDYGLYDTLSNAGVFPDTDRQFLWITTQEIYAPNSGAAKVQTAYGYNSGTQIKASSLYQRTSNVSDGAWGPWSEFYNSGNAPSDSAYTTVTSLDNGWTGTLRYIMRLGWVQVTFEVLDASGAGGSAVILTLPSAYWPEESVRGVVTDGDAPAGRSAISPLGVVSVQGTTGTAIRGSLVYPTL